MRSGYLTAGWLVLCATVAASAADQTNPAAVPDFGGVGVAWMKGAVDFMRPATGIGPVTFDPANPHMSTQTTAQGRSETMPLHIADLSNPNLKDWVKAELQAHAATVLKGDYSLDPRYSPRANCYPGGVPQFLIYGGFEPLYFVQTPTEVLIINQADTQVRHVYMNTEHSRAVRPSWYGESIGHYDGDTLVVDTIGVSDRSVVDSYGTPHTNQMHVVERFRRTDPGALQVDVTVDDPGAFNAPWSAIMRYRRSPMALPLVEEPCNENNSHDFLGQDFHTASAPKGDF